MWKEGLGGFARDTTTVMSRLPDSKVRATMHAMERWSISILSAGESERLIVSKIHLEIHLLHIVSSAPGDSALLVVSRAIRGVEKD